MHTLVVGWARCSEQSSSEGEKRTEREEHPFARSRSRSRKAHQGRARIRARIRLFQSSAVSKTVGPWRERGAAAMKRAALSSLKFPPGENGDRDPTRPGVARDPTSRRHRGGIPETSRAEILFDLS